MPTVKEYIKRIEEEGYCVLDQIYTADQVKRAYDLTLQCYEESVGSQCDRVPFLNRNHPIVYNLQNKDFYFSELLFCSDDLNQILKHFLNDPWFTSIPPEQPNYILRAFSARSSNDALPMHIDSFVPYVSPYVFVMQYAIVLEDQTRNNGCTVVVPRSHLAGEYTSQQAFEEAIPIECKAGDVVIWDSRLWHGTTANTGSGTRWSLIATFCRWWLKQHFDITRSMPQEIYECLTDPQKAVMGFCSTSYYDESCGIDLKRGYDLLPQRVEETHRRAEAAT